MNLNKSSLSKFIVFITFDRQSNIHCWRKSAAYLSQTLLDEWNNELPFMMVLSDETVADQAGFLINDQGVQYNFLSAALYKISKER